MPTQLSGAPIMIQVMGLNKLKDPAGPARRRRVVGAAGEKITTNNLNLNTSNLK